MNMSKSFTMASYKGSFRDYQRHLLKKLEHRLDERKLNIVTPPGSGKVVLGLELIRHIGEPCLIISTTDAMLDHWMEHFVTCFLPKDEQDARDEYLSYNLKEPALLTAITYDTLQAAVKKSTVTRGDMTVSFEDTDVIRLVQDSGIHTILLDEPHHLDSRQNDALESFLGVLGGEFRVLSMTGTPPYDFSGEEMDRYLNLCGEISEEIYIPELVKGGALCPHQDYVYFNYPTESESEGIKGYRTRVDKAVAESVTLPFMGELGRRVSKLYTRQKMDYLYNHHEAMVGIIELLYEYGHRVNIAMYTHLTGRKKISPLTADSAQHAFNLLLESQTLLRDTEKEQLTELFARHHLMDHGRVQLTLTSKVRRTLMASAGKLSSITAIAEAEAKSMGDSLRMVIMTDPVSDSELAHLGKDTHLYDLSLVCAFTALTGQLPELPVGCLTETRAVLPDTAMSLLTDTWGAQGITTEPTGIEGYSFYTFEDSLRKNELAARLFHMGHIRVLVGSAQSVCTGWDDSFVNVLIDAAPNGAFTDSHRMRGRVIHADKTNPSKVAHIWHLVTLEQTYSAGDDNSLRLASRLTANADGGLSSDFRHLRRRFECYMGPNADTDELENGIDRLGLKLIPHQGSMKAINEAMLERAKDREKLTAVWMNAMLDTTKPISEVRVPKTAKVPVFTSANTMLVISSLVGLIGGIFLASFFIKALIVYLFFNPGQIMSLAVVAVLLLLTLTVTAIIFSILFILHFLPLPINHMTTASSIRSLCRNLLKTLKDIGAVNKDAVMVMEPLPDKNGYRLYIDNCGHDEQLVFQKSVEEMLSPIRSARYILIRSGWFRKLLWRWSFACPAIIARNDVWVKIFEKYIRRSMGSMKFQYTRRDPGRKHLIIARNKGYLNLRSSVCEKRIHLLKTERIL